MKKKVYASFILPAEDGCNQKCPDCFVGQRKESVETNLRPEDYLRFLHDLLRSFCVSRVALQGFEPLLPSTWLLTEQMLALATAYQCETSLITNGTYLADRAAALRKILASIAVSVNSAEAVTHDKTRGVPGALEQTLIGIRAASYFGSSLIVNSILFPGRRRFLEGMPRLLAELGVTKWAMTPLIDSNRGAHVPSSAYVSDTLLYFADVCKPLGIKVILSDEARKLPIGGDLIKDVVINSLREGDAFFRLSPDGHCARLDEVLGTVDGTPQWDTFEKPSKFVERIFAEKAFRTAKKNPVMRALSPLADRAFKRIIRLREAESLMQKEQLDGSYGRK